LSRREKETAIAIMSDDKVLRTRFLTLRTRFLTLRTRFLTLTTRF
jgi:hypothetical protein